MKWSVGFEAEGDRVMALEEIVELADAVAIHQGMAAGIGTQHYGARMIVEAETRDEAIAKGTEQFVKCAERAGLPKWPIGRIEAVSEDDEEMDYEQGGF